jgi:hypothetical protein
MFTSSSAQILTKISDSLALAASGNVSGTACRKTFDKVMPCFIENVPSEEKRFDSQTQSGSRVGYLLVIVMAFQRCVSTRCRSDDEADHHSMGDSPSDERFALQCEI